jgi:cell division protein FtsQ
MILKRGNSKPKLVRKIIRRASPAVGSQPVRKIVKRTRGGGVTPGPVIGERPGGQGPGGPRLPRLGAIFRKRYLYAGIALCILAGVVSGGAWIYRSPFFRVTEVSVQGNERVPTDTIVGAADLIGASMFTADLATAQKELYELPLVNSVRIERAWPHTLKIVVEERKAWGTWEQGDVQYTIDRNGVVLGVGPAPDGSPIIVSSEPGSRQQGDHVDYQAVDAAAEIYEKLPRQLGTTVKQVAFIAGKGVQVTTANGQTALLGDSSSIAYKLAVWAAMAQQAQTQRINYTTIDLRYGNRPVLQ